jgi:D-alanyl-D-alanine dipeptidase
VARLTLVSLTNSLPEAIFDLRYATSNNVTGKVLDEATSIARLDIGAATRLRKASTQFKERGFKLVIWDAYRSERTQAELRAIDPDEKYVLEKSQHALGLAVDITLATEDGTLLDMGTDHDDFSERAHPDSTDVTDLQQNNRLILIETMAKFGFKVWPYEWWHFDFVQD